MLAIKQIPTTKKIIGGLRVHFSTCPAQMHNTSLGKVNDLPCRFFQSKTQINVFITQKKTLIKPAYFIKCCSPEQYATSSKPICCDRGLIINWISTIFP